MAEATSTLNKVPNQEEDEFKAYIQSLDTMDEDMRKDKIWDCFKKFCQEGLKNDLDKEHIKELLKHESLNLLRVDSNGWSGLQWAVVNNHPEVVKIVYPIVKKEEEKIKEEEERRIKEENANARKINDLEEDFKKPENPAKKGKYSPLHWSAYKGYDLISSILLHLNCNPFEVDKTGNNALHQACASNKMSTFKMFMSLGIDLELKNARSHTPIDLVNNKEILDLIKKCLGTKECSICKKHFDFNNKRYICSINNEIICEQCCKTDYYYETEESQEKDLRDCRCKNCYEQILKVEENLRNAINSGELAKVSEQFEISKNYKIDEHLKKEARYTEDKLRREKKIKELMDSLKVIENHKTINKSDSILLEMLEDATKHNVDLDGKIIEDVLKDHDRLVAEKALRTLLDNLTVADSSKENLDNLRDLNTKAKNQTVSDVYTKVADALDEKIDKNLKAKELLQKFVEYPIREYPEVEVVDPKKKKQQAPPPKKKSKKKKEEFLVPEWATELTVLEEKVKEFTDYLKIYQEIGLSEDFKKSGNEQMARFKKEIPFRKNEEEEKRRIEEEKAAKKKKKK